MEILQIIGRASGRRFWQDQQCVAELLDGKRILITAVEKSDAAKTIIRLKELLKEKNYRRRAVLQFCKKSNIYQRTFRYA